MLALIGKWILAIAVFSIISATAFAVDTYCIATDNLCGSSPDDPSSPLGSNGSVTGFTLNPAETPVKDQLGFAAIWYKVQPQFMFVKGTGRIGAAVSPSNGDDTFFGNPSFETQTDYLYRRQNSLPFIQSKFALGLAATLFDNQSDMWTRLQGSLGVLGRYVQASNRILPGVGLTFLVGPLQLSGSISQDETGVSAEGLQSAYILRDQAASISAGLSLGSVLLDYTKLNLVPEIGNPLNVDLANISVIWRKFVFSAAYRIEKSDRPGYDSNTASLITKPVKENIYGGVQYSVFSFAQIGVFYDYFLLDEISVGATVFF